MMIPWLTPEKQLQAHLLLKKEKETILLLQMTTNHAYCPSCGTKSLHLHSRYTRFLYDLPFGSQHTAIHFVSRKWFCDENDCTQRIFTERFPWLKPYARRTERLQQLLRTLAFSMICLQAEKLAISFLPKMSHDTFLRLIRATPTPVSIPSAVGIDDFRFEKVMPTAH
ncbi:transposase family protein [Bacillus xiapuensis]|uniref:transposase family protein n=1 Tax=Bacillus xiapuensis TaxID=2014075 RepID=UPI000C248CDD|nr:transposase family protein [Bacillus xiapuensis]